MDIPANPVEPNQNPEQQPIKPLGKLNKDGTPRKCNLTQEQKLKRAEILAKGREKAHQKRRELEAAKKKNIPVSKPIPIPEPEPEPVPAHVEEKKDDSDDDDIEYVSKKKAKKKKKGKKVIIVDESSSSSSEDEVIVKRKKKKKIPTPPPPPPQPTPPPFVIEKPKPSIPQPTEEELNKLRQDKIRRYNAKKQQDRLMASIFGS